MKHQVGDLLWIPQATMLYKGPNNPMAVKFNSEPKVGLFLNETGYDGYILTLVDGQEWIVEEKHVRKVKEEEKYVS